MSAGNTPAEARTQALSEIFERHIKFRIISEGLCLPDVPEATSSPAIRASPPASAACAMPASASWSRTPRSAAIPGDERDPAASPDQGCFSSFGAHPRFEIALERALTELLQGRALDALAGFPEPGFDLDEIASAPNIEIHFVDSSGIISWNFLGAKPDFEFHDWNFSDHHGRGLRLAGRAPSTPWPRHLRRRLRHLGVYACRILVPGMSEIYPIDDLEWENNSVGNTSAKPSCTCRTRRRRMRRPARNPE
jgi:ribosomal protein S12 methylthiotransferase accessory factor